MPKLIRNREYRLHHVDNETGLGIMHNERTAAFSFLSPLGVALWNSDTQDFEPESLFTDTPWMKEVVDTMVDSGILQPIFPSGTFGSVSKKKARDSSDPQVLQNLYFYCTRRCNARCYHCYQPTDYDSGRIGSRPEQVSAERFLSIVDQALALGLKSVKITGGEPFLRMDVTDIIHGASERGVDVSVETNGTRINRQTAEMLVETGTHVSISIDSPIPEKHDRLRRMPGAFERAFATLETLCRLGGKPKIIMSVSHANYDEIEDLIQVAISAGCDCVKLNPVSTLGVAKKLSDGGLLLSLEEVMKLFAKRRALEKKWNITMFIEGPPAFADLFEIVDGRMAVCPFTNILGILANGDISFCGIGNVRRELVLGNIFEAQFNLGNFWNNSPELLELRKIMTEKIQGVCGLCIFESFCKGSCRALAYDRHGAFNAPHSWCQQAYEKGLFPVHYLVRREGGHWHGSQGIAEDIACRAL